VVVHQVHRLQVYHQVTNSSRGNPVHQRKLNHDVSGQSQIAVGTILAAMSLSFSNSG